MSCLPPADSFTRPFFCLVLLLLVGLNQIARAQDSLPIIENQAAASYTSLRLGVTERLWSNIARLEVGANPTFQCTGGGLHEVVPGGIGSSKFRCTNTGNVSVRLSWNHRDGEKDFSLDELIITRDINSDGIAGSGETPLGLSGSIILLPSESLTMVLSGRVPSNAQVLGEDLLSFNTPSQSWNGVALWRPGIGTPLTKKILIANSWSENGQLAYELTSINTSLTALEGVEIVVDGVASKRVLLEDLLPANTVLVSAQSEFTEVLYHNQGDPANTFTSQPPTDLSMVNEVAFALPRLRAGQAMKGTVILQANLNAAGELTNQAQMHFTVNGERRAAPSEPVTVILPKSENTLKVLNKDGRPASYISAEDEFLDLSVSLAACNKDRSVAEHILGRLSTRRGMDNEIVKLWETGPNSGIFKVYQIPVVFEQAVVATDNVLQLMPNDQMDVEVDCGGNTLSTSLMANPVVRVYNSRNGEVIAGARVTLHAVATAASANKTSALDEVNTGETIGKPWLEGYVTNSKGVVDFGELPPGDYRVEVYAGDKMRFPSSYPATLQPLEFFIHTEASYGDWHVVDQPKLAFDIPVDPQEEPGLALEKVAGQSKVMPGELVNYRLRLANQGYTPIFNVTLADTLPLGFRPAPGSGAIDGQPANLQWNNSGQLQWQSPMLLPGETIELTYLAQPGENAFKGDGINRATLSADDATPVSAEAAVHVLQPPMRYGALILGRVYCDSDGNGLPGAHEQGIEGARIYMETGTYATSGSHGKFHFEGVSPQTHVLRLDPLTIPPGSRPVATAQDYAAQAQSRFVDTRSGELKRVDFALERCSANQRPTEAEITVLTKLEESTKSLNIAPVTDTPSFSGLSDGDIIQTGQATLDVITQFGTNHTLTVNGVPVNKEQRGLVVSDRSNGSSMTRYVGVQLRPGDNQLHVVQKDSFGIVRGEQFLHLAAPAEASGLHIDVTPNKEHDDRYQLFIRVVDADGRQTPATGELTLTTSAGHLSADHTNTYDTQVQTLVLHLHQGSVSAELLAPEERGGLLIKAEYGSLSENRHLLHGNQARGLLVNGLVQVRLGLNDGYRGEFHDGFAQSVEVLAETPLGSNSVLAGRTALFIKGKIKGDWLLTMAYDSDKDRTLPAIDDIDPEAWYPVYGDESTQGNDAVSRSSLYVLLEQDGQQYLYGDFETDQALSFRAGAYRRNLNGARGEWMGDFWQFSSFVAEKETTTGFRELAGLGTTGPYRVSENSLTTGSELVTIVTRDRDLDGLVLQEQPLARFVDYSINYMDGTIMLNQPLASYDESFNPQFLRVRYETHSPFADGFVTGVSGSAQLAGATVQSRVVHTGGDHNGGTLAAVLVKTGDRDNGLELEVAHNRLDAGDSGGAATLSARRGNDKREVTVDATYASDGFNNSDSTLRAGAQLNLVARQKLDETLTLEGEAKWMEQSGDRSYRVAADLKTIINPGFTLRTGIYRAASEASVLTAVQAGAVWQPKSLPNLNLNTRYRQGINSNAQSLELGGEYRLNNGVSLYTRHEKLDGMAASFGYADNYSQERTVVGIKGKLAKHTQSYAEYRLDDGLNEHRAQAVSGIRTDIPLSESLSLGGSFEKITPLSKDSDNSLAGSVSLAWAGAENWRSGSRIEYRESSRDRSLLLSLVTVYKLNDDWTTFAKINRFRSEDLSSGVTTPQRLLRLGAAYRPLGGKLHWLARYEDRLRGASGASSSHNHTRYLNSDLTYTLGNGRQLSASGDWRITRASLQGYNTTDRAWMGGLSYQIQWGEDWFGQLHGRRYMGKSDLFEGRESHWGYGVEIGRTITEGLVASVGYNGSGFRDAVFSSRHHTARGWYLEIDLKFDESWFGWLQ